MNNNRINITIKLNGEEIIFPKQQPGLINGTSVAPISVIFEKLGYSVEWEPRAIRLLGIIPLPIGKLTLTKDDVEIEIYEYTNSFKVNGDTHEFPEGHYAKQVGNDIMTPIRDILESVGCTVRWDGTTRTVDISTEPIGYFRIKNAEDKYLTYAGGINSRVTVTTANDSVDQIWKIERTADGTKYHIRPAKYNSLALNVYGSGDYPCTLHSSDRWPNDTSFDIEVGDNQGYLICWNYPDIPRYLTEGNDIVDERIYTYWVPNSQQEWILEPTNMPVIPTVNIIEPASNKVIVSEGETNAISVRVSGENCSKIELYINDNLFVSENSNSLSYGFLATEYGRYSIKAIGISNTGTTDSEERVVIVKDINNSELAVTNFNKEYIGNDDCIRNSGCAVCCAADIVSYYNGRAISLTELRDTYQVYKSGDATCDFDKMPGCRRYQDDSCDMLTNENLCNVVKEQIDSGHPVLLHYTSKHNTKYGHWVVAYKYVNQCTNINDIYICDPSHTKATIGNDYDVKYARNPPYCEEQYNNGMTIQECITEESIHDLWEIYLTEIT